MSKIRKVIKLYCRGNSKQFISNYLSLSRNTVKKYISFFELEGLSLEWIENKSDSELEELFCSGKALPVNVKLDALYSFFPQMERALKKVGVTVAHMWENTLPFILTVLGVRSSVIITRHGVNGSTPRCIWIISPEIRCISIMQEKHFRL